MPLKVVANGRMATQMPALCGQAERHEVIEALVAHVYAPLPEHAALGHGRDPRLAHRVSVADAPTASGVLHGRTR